MSIQSLSSAAHTALNGLQNVFREVEQVAVDVAYGTHEQSGENFSQSLSSLARLPELRMRALANAKVLSTTEELLSDFTLLPRR